MPSALCDKCGRCLEGGLVEAGGKGPPCTVINGDPCVFCIKIAELKSKISVTKVHLDELEAELSRVHTAANAVHDPFHRLPVELVTQIIYLCGTDPLKYPRSTWNVQPLSFGNVCRGWRNIIYNSPTLWTKLDIAILHCLNNAYSDNIRPNFSIPRLWLARARALPLDVGIRFICPTSQLGYDEFEELYAILREQAAQWKIARFWYLPRDMIRLWFSTPSPRIDSILEKLTISVEDCGDTSEEDDEENCILLAHHSPSNICLLHFYPSFVNLDWSKLTSITVKPYRFCFQEIYNLFKTAPALHYFHVSCRRVEYIDVLFEVPEPFHHLRLRQLFIEVLPEPEEQYQFENYDPFNYTDSLAIDKLLRSIRLPALVSFSFEGRCDLSSSPLQELFRESGSPIKNLTLSNLPFRHDYFNEEAILDLFTTTPYLEALTIKQSKPRDEPCLTTRFFSQFASTTSLPFPLLPSLQTFAYTARRSYPWTTLEDIARRLQLGPLNEVELEIIGTPDAWEYGYLPDYIDREIAQRLSASSVKGLTIKDWPFGNDFILESLRVNRGSEEGVDEDEDVLSIASSAGNPAQDKSEVEGA
ncbi:hypothetical protein CPB83DRAFT_862561 [Crepidotus variabilis]|uniref:F-box domain-containing protein n=1 Tax=Crepidotus variabilis TaxID=179855 RepID=A0A9P6JK87_9AGAR|nr:hypothetical protein CPB83DRAFT_862561 [Crepidotus variabilis]